MSAKCAAAVVDGAAGRAISSLTRASRTARRKVRSDDDSEFAIFQVCHTREQEASLGTVDFTGEKWAQRLQDIAWAPGALGLD